MAAREQDMTGSWRGRALAIVVSLMLGPAGMARQEGAPETRPYLRLSEDAGGDAFAIEVSAREFVPDDPTRPAVHLVGAVHIADRVFFDALQEFLDQRDVVLFEGVKPAGAGAGTHDGELDESAKVRTTERRLRFLAVAAEKYTTDKGAPPASLDELADGLETRVGSLVRASTQDAWGNAIRYSPPPDEEPVREQDPDSDLQPARPRWKVDFVSFGADGAPGGEGSAADLKFSTQKPLTRDERAGGGDGIQQQLADAFGLVFQLQAMDENKPNWRNSDLSIDQVQRRLDEAGAGGDMLFGMLDGSSLMGRLMGVMLRMIGSFPEGRAMFKIMLAETLSRADLMFESMPGELGPLMDVLIKDRNAIVIEDLDRIIRTEPGVRTIGVIYGAGHLPDLERRLAGLGYSPGDDTWHPAIRVSSESENLPRGSIKQMRPMIRRMLDMQLRQMERMREREKPPR
jgi:Type II secretion system (T2SS), protein G